MVKSFIHRIQADTFHKFNCIQAFTLPQSENISASNGRVFTTFCMSELVWLRCMYIVQAYSKWNKQNVKVKKSNDHGNSLGNPVWCEAKVSPKYLYCCVFLIFSTADGDWSDYYHIFIISHISDSLATVNKKAHCAMENINN